jgi:hypothetical protein
MLILGTLCFRDMQTTRPTIAIDIDGVIYDIIAHITNECLTETFRGYRPSNWSCWEEFGITKNDFFRYYSECWKNAGNHTGVAFEYTHPHARDLFNILHDEGYRISIITKRTSKDIVNTIKYLENFHLHYDTFTIITDTEHKTNEYFDAIIDDYPFNLAPNKLGILVNQEWNKNYELKSGQYRINNLLEAIPLIQKFLPLPSSSLPS